MLSKVSLNFKEWMIITLFLEIINIGMQNQILLIKRVTDAGYSNKDSALYSVYSVHLNQDI